MSITAWGVGLATLDANGATLDVRFRAVGLGEAIPSDAPSVNPSVDTDRERGVAFRAVSLVVDTAAAPGDSADAYLRLNVMSQRLMKPRSMNLDGIFGQLPNVVWTNAGPVHPDDFTALRPRLLRAGIQAQGIDRFPRLTDYVTPDRVRIADVSRVRLGAHLAPGTVIMHEGFVNFNAGTLGTSMVEGRISQGVVVGDGSDIGGGASIMGTLSGGGTEKVKIGQRSLLGANSGIGISIGDDCVVEAGLYVTAGTKVNVIDGENTTVLKAKELSGVNNLLFRRNSLTGAVEVTSRTGVGIVLNSALH